MLLKTNTKEKIISLLICFLMGVLFICLFSYSTSILYPYYFGGDTAQFLTIGKAWYLGKIPYIDMFDHKGPIIFFIDMLGFTITNGNKAGVSIIQIIFMLCTISAIFEISQFVTRNNYYGVFAVIVTLVSMKMNYIEGNSVEEYCLPFLCWSTYGLLVWYNGDRKEHNCKWALFYGITASVCLLTRVTNIVPICGGIFVICIYLLRYKYIKNLLENAFSFIIGFLIILIPFVIYFGIKGGLYDMFYSTLLYNFEYSKGCQPWILTATSDSIKNFLKTYFVYYIIFIIIAIKIAHKDFLISVAYSMTALAETYLFMSGYLFGQYPLVCVVQVVLLLNELFALIDSSSSCQRLTAIFLSCWLLFFLYNNCIYESATSAIDNYFYARTHSERMWENLFNEIPSEDLESFVAYGGNEFKELYLLTNSMPCYKYHVIQDWHSAYSETIKNNIRNAFESANAKWILTDTNIQVIQDILEDQYIIYDEDGDFKLYKKNGGT